ncbi:hypothetical protein [Nocardia sp. CNY236]|uniref:hypothetical protein n=1 Tax=Nocardia sp. CNY236 TaxID=1169152 RepID=UPI000415C318|nr:hypothetical protein [Nocardia sp. CNY236]
MRIAIMSVSVLAGIAAVGTALGSGSAVAEPGDRLGDGRIGIHLNHDATTTLAGGPIPAVITMIVPPDRIGAGLRSDSTIYRDEHGRVHASLRQVVLEAAEHPDGTVTVYLNAPGTHGGRVLDIYQHWNRGQ